MNDMIEVTEEVPHGARGRCFGSIHPYPEYGGGIRLVIKKVILIRVIKLRPDSADSHDPHSLVG